MLLFVFILILLFVLTIVYFVIYMQHLIESMSGHNYDWSTFENMHKVIQDEMDKYDITQRIIKSYVNDYIHYQYKVSNRYGIWNDFFVCEKYKVYADDNYMVFNPVEYLKYMHWFYKNIFGAKRVKGIWDRKE